MKRFKTIVFQKDFPSNIDVYHALNQNLKFCFVIITHQLPQPKLNAFRGIKIESLHRVSSLSQLNTHLNNHLLVIGIKMYCMITLSWSKTRTEIFNVPLQLIHINHLPYHISLRQAFQTKKRPCYKGKIKTFLNFQKIK